MNVKERAEFWLAEYDSKRAKPTTVQAHRYLIRNHIIPHIGETELTMLTEQDVLCFLDELSLRTVHAWQAVPARR